MIFGKGTGMAAWGHNSLLIFGEAGKGIYWQIPGLGNINYKQECCHRKLCSPVIQTISHSGRVA